MLAVEESSYLTSGIAAMAVLAMEIRSSHFLSSQARRDMPRATARMEEAKLPVFVSGKSSSSSTLCPSRSLIVLASCSRLLDRRGSEMSRFRAGSLHRHRRSELIRSNLATDSLVVGWAIAVVTF